MTTTPQERAAAYIRRLPVSVAGQGGHAAAFHAAVAAVRGFDLSDSDALDVLRVWNAACVPPWNEADLRHKIKSARLDGQRPFGCLLDKADNVRLQTPAERREIEQRRERQRLDAERYAMQKQAERAAHRSRWPTMRPPNAAEVARIAELRRLPVQAVLAASRLGWLRAGLVDGHACFILTEGTFAQARRLDGGKLTLRGGKEAKAKNLLGSEGHFLGLQRIDGPARVLLVEGCIGLLEGLSLLELADPAESWAVLAATSASSRLSSSPAALTALAGRRVTIILDNDEAGAAGAATWLADLTTAGCDVKAIRPPAAFKDLGEHLASSSATLAEYLK
jgi:hypothetical protein